MTRTCRCGGQFRRTDIEGYWDPKLRRTMYRDTDPVKANWRCNKCGTVRTQRKRRSKHA